MRPDPPPEEIARRLLTRLRVEPAGMTLTEVTKALNNNVTTAARDRVISDLRRRGLVSVERVERTHTVTYLATVVRLAPGPAPGPPLEDRT